MKQFLGLSAFCAALVGGLIELKLAIEPPSLRQAPWYLMILVYICGGMLIARLCQWGAKKQIEGRKEGRPVTSHA